MEPIRPQHSRTPSRATSLGQPIRPRPMMSDFGPRRPAAPAARPQAPAITATPAVQALKPTTPQQPTPHKIAPTHHAVAPPQQPARTIQPSPSPAAIEQRVVHTQPASHSILSQPDKHETKGQKEPHETGHAGLVGFVIFIVLGALLLSPLIPGKILDNFPGSSQSLSSGEQSLACITDLQIVKTSTNNTTKLGSPLVYRYATQTTESASCTGKNLSTVIGTSAQFNPVAGVIDLLLVVVVAFIVSRLWRKFFGVKHRH